MPLDTVREVANTAKKLPSETFLVESNYLDAQSRAWLIENGGKELPSSFALP